MINFLKTQDPCDREPSPEDRGSAWVVLRIVQERRAEWRKVKGMSHWNGPKSSGASE